MARKKCLVDKWELRNALIKLPGVKIKGHGWCIPIKDLNNAIDDMTVANKEEVLAYFLPKVKEKWDKDVEDLGSSLSQLLSAKVDPPEYKGMNPKPYNQDYYKKRTRPKQNKPNESDKDIDVFERP